MFPESRNVLIVGGTREMRLQAAADQLKRRAEECRAPLQILRLLPETLPFELAGSSLTIAPPRGIRIDDLERGVPNQQGGATRLILTQSTYTIQKWLDLLGSDDMIVATADREAIEQGAPEAFQRRGPWRTFAIIDLGIRAEGAPTGDTPSSTPLAGPSGTISTLVAAYRSSSPDERLQLCRETALTDPTSAIAALALASACREQQDLAGTRQELGRAIALAPDWEAVHYEDGKFWLAVEEMERARDAFQRAANLMPTFSAAFSNLGATLGELGQPEAALAAFEHAVAADPDNYMLLNNIGVVTRELGRLEESETALRRLVSREPEFVFGHYNLGHTLFLSGQYREALAAYEDGQRRDPYKNPRQGCRLAIVRLANGDIQGAERDLWHFADQAPPEEREDLLMEAYEITDALIRHTSDAAEIRAFLDRIATELGHPGV